MLLSVHIKFRIGNVDHFPPVTVRAHPYVAPVIHRSDNFRVTAFTSQFTHSVIIFVFQGQGESVLRNEVWIQRNIQGIAFVCLLKLQMCMIRNFVQS